jgi:chromosome segregation ATPase
VHCPPSDQTATLRLLLDAQQWSGTVERRFEALIAALETKFGPLDAGLVKVAALVDQGIPARVDRLEAKHTSLAHM